MARSLAPDDPRTTAVLGPVAFDANDFAWSYDLLRESARQLGSDARVLHDLAWSAYSLGKVTEARDAMERSLNASPDADISDDGKMFLTLTAIEMDSAAPVPAQTEIDSELKTHPQYVPALMAAARLDLKQGNKTSATERYQEALRRFPDFAPAQKQLALLYADDPAHNAEANDLASKARKGLPDDPAVAQLLGRLACEKRDYAGAIQFLEASERKQPLDATGLYYLGVARLASDQKSSGRQALNQALAHGLEEPLASTAKKALADSARPR
jgi:tetratricopeptide (TPR) repeat protein